MSEIEKTGWPNETIAMLTRRLRKTMDEPLADTQLDLREHLSAGIRVSAYVDGSALIFGMGSERKYDVVFGDGARFIVYEWGNTDGYGIVLERVDNHVPAVADVLLAMRRGLPQSDAVKFLGGNC